MKTGKESTTSWREFVAMPALLIAIVLVAQAARIEDASEDQAGGPSVLLVTIDTLRADHLGTYGYFRDTSPVMDALAKESIVFELCLTPLAATLPAHTSLLTGFYPLEHGIMGNINFGKTPFSPRPGIRSFAEFARAQKMRTAGFVSATPLKRHSGIHSGFEVFEDRVEGQRRAEDTNAKVSDWLDRFGKQRFFLWVHYFDPHYPYEPPASFDLFRTDAVLESHMKERGIAGSATRPSQQVLDTRRAINGYDGEIRYVDHQLGLLFEKLQSLGLWEDLVVVLTSDHGEGMGEHGMIGHGYVHREQVQVPLMMRVPGQKARQVEAPISLVDVFPTVLGLLGKESWSDFLEQATGIDVLAETAPSQALLSQRSVRPRPDVRGPAYALTSQRWRYVHEPEGRSRLFNWSTDPYELNDLSDSNGEKIEALQEQLTQQIGTQVKRGAQLGDDGADHAIPLEPNTIEELRALGYID